MLCPEGKFTRSLPDFWNHEGRVLWNKGRGLPLSLDLSRHPLALAFRSVEILLFATDLGYRGIHFEEPSVASPCRGRGKQGTHQGRLFLCPCTGHHTPSPGPESLLILRISYNSHQVHPPSSTPLRSLSLCPGSTKPIIFGVVPPDSYARVRRSHFFRSQQCSEFNLEGRWTFLLAATSKLKMLTEIYSEQNMSIFYSIMLEFFAHWCYRLQTYLPSSWNSHQTTCEVRRKIGSPIR